jgi:hypothetical protein
MIGKLLIGDEGEKKDSNLKIAWDPGSIRLN